MCRGFNDRVVTYGLLWFLYLLQVGLSSPAGEVDVGTPLVGTSSVSVPLFSV